MTTIHPPHRTAVVTGASRGFGRAIAVRLASTGAHVVGVGRDEEALHELGRQLGDCFTPVTADVTDDEMTARLIDEHQPNLLVLNAGATPHPATIQDQTWATFSENWNISLDGTPGGGDFNIRDTAGSSRTIQLDSYWMSVNTHHRIVGELWFNAGVGYTFGNEIEVQSNNGSNPSFSREMDGAPLAQIGLSLRKW